MYQTYKAIVIDFLNLKRSFCSLKVVGATQAETCNLPKLHNQIKYSLILLKV